MKSPMQNILEGVKLQAESRLLAEQKAKAITEAEATEQAGTEAIEEMSPQQMAEAFQVLSKAVMELTNKANGGA